ncbi:MAG: hypothetical protein OXG81_03890 [Acidobacteria bacterium]|nr:hypothetical protein [Acidobacteriota bacterium]
MANESALQLANVPAYGRRVVLAAFGGSGPEGPRTQRAAPVWLDSLHADDMTPLRAHPNCSRASRRTRRPFSGCADLLVRSGRSREAA